MKTIMILKRNGRREPLDIRKIQEYTTAAVRGLENFETNYEFQLSPTWKFFKNAAIGAMEKIEKMSLEKISTYKYIKELTDYLELHPTFFKHFNKWERHSDTGELYNMSLFECLSIIASIGYGHTLITMKFSREWRRGKDAIKRIYETATQFNDPATNIKSLFDFAVSFDPQKINQYIAKILQQVGVSLYAIKMIFKDGMTRITKKLLDKIILPALTIKIYA